MDSKVEEPPQQLPQESPAPVIEKPVEVTEPVETKGDQPDSDDEIDSKLYTVPGTGRTVTLQMLLSANVLTPGKSLMSIEYLGQKFVGDLLPDGKIKSQETETIFCSPSAWAIHCKRIINPDKKSGCGWASVKYKGKKLDVYKATWMRKCQIQRDQRDQSPTDEEEEEKNMEPPPPPPKRFVVPHNTIINRHIPHDSNTLIEAVDFATLGKIQPFLVTITTSAALLIDFHCHLTKNEVCGYLGGTWDVNSHTLFITHTYPCRNSRYDREAAAECEYNIQKSMIQQNVNLVGWYHSHPVFSANPTLRDCDTQLDYQIKMRGLTEASYTPCVGIICSPYDIENSMSESKFLAYWVHPPAENKPAEYGRPMLMNFAIQQDDTLQDGLQEEMQLCVDYYKQFKNELIAFERNFLNETSFISKMKTSLFSKFPRNQSDGAFWNWIRQLLGLAMEEVVELPKIMKQAQQHQQLQQQPAAVQQEPAGGKTTAVKEDENPSETESETTQNLHAIQALQQQLAQPSGLNMTPSPLATALHLPTVTSASGNANNVGNSTSNTNTTTSPRDSPVTIPSNSASPAKFEIPIRASPSPAKSDASSCRTRNSPAPSPGKMNILGDPIARSSPSAKSDFGADLYAATLASLAGKSQSELNANDLSALLQYTKKSDLYGLAALNALQSGGMTGAAAPPGSKGGNSGLPPIPNIKEFMAQLEKGNLSLLMQSQYPMASMPSMSHHSASGSSKSSDNKSSSKHDKSSSSSSASHYSKQQQQQQQQLHDLYNYPTSASKSGTSGSGRSSQSQSQSHLIELDDFKSDRQLAELMKSPEYTQMLLQQAQALSGLGSEISVTKKPTKKSSAAQAAAAAASAPYSLPPLPTAADLNQLLEASQRIPELNNLLQSANPNDINALLSLQSAQMLSKSQLDYASLFGSPMSGMGSGGSSKSSSKHQQQQQQQAAAAAAAAAQQYMGMTQQDLSALFGITPQAPAASSSKKSSTSSSSAADKNQMHSMPNPAEMLNSLFTAAAGKMGDMSSFMGNWGAPSPSSAQSSAYTKSLSDLNAMFGGSATSASGSGAGNSGSKSSNPFDPAMMFPHVSPSKMQELFQQSKYPSIIPDPLASSTLAANNLYLSPSLLKLQQEAAKSGASPLMKPPKSSSSSSTTSSLGKIETPPPPLSSSPAISEKLHRSTPTKSCESPAPPLKYNFSAADLAVSSVSPAISASSDYSGKLSHTPPIGAMDGMLNLSATPTPPIKKRMEFSSIADLAAPPPHKMPKMDDEGDEGSGSAVLNLSNN